MGIELPPELADVAAATGLSWPQADEDKLRAQATAWRDAQTRLTSLATDADHTACGVVGALSGTAADAAGKQWSGFVDPEHGRLTAAARGAGEAADRLDHAADQVCAAKVEMVRQLVSAAKNRDAAQTAASAGHPTALLGLDTGLRGTATNLSAVTRGLVDAVGPAGESSTVSPLVDPNPGAHTPHGQAGLLSAVTGLPGPVLSGAGAVVTPLTDKVMDTVDTAGTTADVVDKVAAPVVANAVGPGDEPVVDRVVPAVDEAVAPVAGDGAGVVDQAFPAAGHSGGFDGADGSTMDTPRQLPRVAPPPPIPDWDVGTGPIQLPPPPPQAADPSPYGGFLVSGGFDDVATPPSGIPLASQSSVPHPHEAAMPPPVSPLPSGTVASGFTDAAYSPPPAAPISAYVPGAMPPEPPAAPSPGYAPPPFAPGPPPVAAPPVAGGPVASGGPVVAGGGMAVPPPGGVPGAPAAPAAPAVPTAQPVAARGMPYRGSGAGNPAVPGSPYPAAPRPEPPRPFPPLGAPRQERESIVALFLVHMFPIGHLPVAADRPARQLPVPPPDADYAPGLRFPPHDHPRSDLIDSSDALGKVRSGLSRLPTPTGSPPPGLTDGYDPLAGLHERDWDRRFLAGLRDGIPEYAWPPGELYPEGGGEAGEPEVLAEGIMLDRFGGITGRVFAPADTPFAHRSLPPSALEAGYRRYHVLRAVPMWRALSTGWFGQPGGGVRYRAIYSADELVTMGYLADVTFGEVA